MTWVSVGVAGVGVAGSLIGNKQQGDASARAARLAGPHSVSGQFGSSSVDANGNMSFSLDPASQQFAGLSRAFSSQALSGYHADPYASVPGQITAAYNNADKTLATSGANAGTNAGNLFQMLQHLGSNPTEIGNNYYQLLAKQAQPGQDQAFNSLQSKLFAQGRLGDTGGALDLKAMFDANAQADIGRQIAGANFGQQWFNNLQSSFSGANNDASSLAANRYNLATNLLNTGNNQNNTAISQGKGFQDLFASTFQPLMDFQKLNSGNPYGAQIAAGQAGATGDMFSGMLGQLTGGGAGSPLGGILKKIPGFG